MHRLRRRHDASSLASVAADAERREVVARRQTRRRWTRMPTVAASPSADGTVVELCRTINAAVRNLPEEQEEEGEGQAEREGAGEGEGEREGKTEGEGTGEGVEGA